ncbi:uroporphyrinogen-III synthase [Foetidibacter luteolus]|uniref:uroporphyrinogen-III synthase n=1 Tax=Foetidibacter luteolus TaxID=2608880 RepID=UPI00129BF186|nr:uroporphyrinogen-III synthase [Foetidibacter luteolus]
MQPDKKVLCTRVLDAQFVSKAAVHHIQIDALPFIEIQKLHTQQFKDQVQQLALQNISVAFTSVNSVESVGQIVNGKPNWKICCIGGVTKDAVVKYFGEEAILVTGKNASVLSRKIIETKNIKEVIFFCGDQRLDDLPETLRTNNIRVQEVIAYHTLQTPHDVQEDYDAVMFFSPTAAHSFFSSNTVRTDVPLFSIGKTTTATIHSYCTNEVITSEWPGQENLVERVVEYFSE